MQEAIHRMTNSLCSILDGRIVAIYLFGSVTMNDFKLGWSDIDILCITKETISDLEAELLVELRQNLLKEDTSNPYYRSFEGAIVSIDEFISNQYTKVVYWGTSGQRVTTHYSFDVFSQFELIKYGQLLFGYDIRDQLTLPTYEQLKSGVQQHYQTIRHFAVQTDDRLYSCGWLLDIARCIYTLHNNDIISKTNVGEWAIMNNLCPVKEEMPRTLRIRNNPLAYKDQPKIKDWLKSLGAVVQSFADVLEKELEMYQ